MEWKISHTPEPYLTTVNDMEERAAAIADGVADERIWLLEHPALYTAGTSAQAEDLIDQAALPVFASGRGGQYTYHGPGQRIVYLQLNLANRGRNVHRFIDAIEQWIMNCLKEFGVTGERRRGRVGVWVVEKDGSEAKIAAIGIRLRRWVSYHGFAINVRPDLSAYNGIIPCGLSEYGVTSLQALGHEVSLADVDERLIAHWPDINTFLTN